MGPSDDEEDGGSRNYPYPLDVILKPNEPKPNSYPSSYKPDLVRILVEGTKTVYGSEKAEQKDVRK